MTPVATVAKWFPDRKGLATGAVVMGFGVGALLLSKVLVPILMLQAQGDLPLVFLLLGVVFACILIPASALLRDPPPGYFAGTGLAGRNGAGPEPPAPPFARASGRANSWSCGSSSSSTSRPESR